ncbi:MAG: pyruvate kinase isozyme chloroplastic [Actinoallomurus sp.]|nr:pyruvate kinase isozyme chloroplastic [Actinoallomurus sp.]
MIRKRGAMILKETPILTFRATVIVLVKKRVTALIAPAEMSSVSISVRTDVLMTLSNRHEAWPDPADLSGAGCTGVRIIAKGRILPLLDGGQLVPWIRAARGKGIRVLLDLPGDKPLVRRLTGARHLATGDEVVLVDSVDESPRQGPGAKIIYVDHGRRLVDAVAVGDDIVVADGAYVFSVSAVGESEVTVRCVKSSTVTLAARSVGLRNAALRVSCPTASELELVGRLDPELVDAFVVSFCEQASQIVGIRKSAIGATVIAKIESSRGYAQAERIAEVADGVLVGRHDLGTEVGPSAVWQIVRNTAELCRRARRPVIVGSGILQSMCDQTTPSAADVADVRRLLSLEVDGLLLAGSISVLDPVRAVRVLRDLAGSPA